MELSAVLAVALARNAVFSSLSTIRFLESMSQARLAAIVAVDLKVIQVPNLGFQTGLLDYFTDLQKKERKKIFFLDLPVWIRKKNLVLFL